jgi:serine/threonine protein kinase
VEESSRPPDTLDGYCLEEDVIHALACGALEADVRSKALAHLDDCELCQALLAEEVRALPQTPSADGAEHQPTLVPIEALVAGRYRIKRFVARGGMGEVYAAWDTLLAERVALKTLNPLAATIDQAKASARFRQEVQLSRRVADPHVCRIYEFGQHLVPAFGTLSYLTMEFIEGQTLGSRLRQGPRLEVSEVLELSRQLLRGLDAAHRVGVLHRDFKSDNVMLRAKPSSGGGPHAVIMDFGLARLLVEEAHGLTNSHELVGSAAYMAPEQLEEGASLSEATDVYAFGVVLFEMLTGHLPFDGKSAMAVALRRLSHPAPPPSTHVPELAREWDALVLRCLERDVARRFASVAEVATALEEVGRRSAAEPQARSRNRRRAWFAVAASAAFAAGLAQILSSRATAGAPAVVPEAGRVTAGQERANPAASIQTPEATVPDALSPSATVLRPGDVFVEPALSPAPALSPESALPLPPGVPSERAILPAGTERAPRAAATTSGASTPVRRALETPKETVPTPAPAAARPAAAAVTVPPPANHSEDVRDVFFLEPPSDPPQNSER